MTGTRRSRYERKPEPGPDTKTRRCLRCGEDFLSQHKGNRICADCQRANADVAPMIEGQPR